MTESLPAVGRHYDQVGAMSFVLAEESRHSDRPSEFDFVIGLGVDFPSCEPVNLLRAAVSMLPNGRATSRSGRHRHYVKRIESCLTFLRQLGRELKRRE